MIFVLWMSYNTPPNKGMNRTRRLAGLSSIRLIARRLSPALDVFVVSHRSWMRLTLIHYSSSLLRWVGMPHVVRAIVESRPARLFSAINVGLMLSLFFQLHTAEEVHCTEALQVSIFDQFIAGRYFYFNYSSDITQLWLFLNLPAWLLSTLLEWMIAPLTYSTVTGYELSWIRASFIVTIASVQWVLIGYGLNKWWRSQAYQ